MIIIDFMIKSFFCLLLLFIGTSCGKAPAQSSSKPLVLVSIAPYQFLVERIVGETFEVQTIVPQAANPHTFEPTAKQVMGLVRGEAFFRIGEPFEDKIVPILKEKNRDLWVSDLRDGIDLLHEEHSPLACSHCAMEHLDRHIWMSPKLAALQVERIVDTLSSRFPAQAKEFEENGLALTNELLDLDQEIRELLESVKKRELLVSHPAFGYFCRDYHIEQLSIEYDGKDPRPHHLEAIFERALKSSIDFTLALPQYNNKGAQLIAERLHVPVKWIDPYSHDYFEMMRHLAHLIAENE